MPGVVNLTQGDVISEGANYITIRGDDRTDDNHVCIDTGSLIDISRFNKWNVSTTAGIVDIVVDHGSGTYTTAPISLHDQGGTAWNTTVIVTVADRTYYFYGCFANIRVIQGDGTDTADVWLRGWN